MHYWLIDIKLKKSAKWMGWALVKGGHLRDHLPLLGTLLKILNGADDTRIRPIKKIEAGHRISGGMKILHKKEER